MSPEIVLINKENVQDVRLINNIVIKSNIELFSSFNDDSLVSPVTNDLFLLGKLLIKISCNDEIYNRSDTSLDVSIENLKIKYSHRYVEFLRQLFNVNLKNTIENTQLLHHPIFTDIHLNSIEKILVDKKYSIKSFVSKSLYHWEFKINGKNDLETYTAYCFNHFSNLNLKTINKTVNSY